MLAEQSVLFLTAIIANFFSAMAGGGVGLIQFPLLIFLGLSFKAALATHKVASVAMGVGALVRHSKGSPLERHFSLQILAFGLPGSILGSLVVLKVPDAWATLALGLMTVGMGLYSIFQPTLGQESAPRNREGRALWLGGLGLFGIGILNGSIASGTGLFVTLLLIRYFGMDYKSAIAYTLILVGLLWNGAGAVVLALTGNVAWSWIPALMLGATVGSYAGTHFGLMKGNLWIKRAFEIMTLLIGVKLLTGI